MQALNVIQLNTLSTALSPAIIGTLIGGHMDDERPVYDSEDFLEIITTDPALKSMVEGRTPREMGFALIHITESYEKKVID